MNRNLRWEWGCLAGSLCSWAVCVLSFAVMGAVSSLAADLLAGIWVLLAFGSAVLGVFLRFRRGTEKRLVLRWGFLVSSGSVWCLSFVLGLSVLQQKTEWDSSSVGGVALGLACAVTAVLTVLYLVLARVGQRRRERVCDEKERE